ncbi:hypothetical protein AcW1_005943 [Taiwanofungus camphoratus]|nr:hypothetical protein AcV5_006259 [Antrodia cinnamomea]KAI0957608.1 hypothetical protein AcW1_005943 [Antrodia cinnamomea]
MEEEDPSWREEEGQIVLVHPPVSIEQRSTYSTLAYAISPRMDCYLELIPQRPYSPRNSFLPMNPIRFRTNERNCICLIDAYQNNISGLERRDDCPFRTMRPGQKRSIRLLWPTPEGGRGYSKFQRQINITASTTISKLAHKIAEKVHTFIEVGLKMSSSSVPSIIRFQQNVQHEYSDNRWKVGEGYLTLGKLMLVELHQVSDASFQPVLMAIRSNAC